MQKKKQEINLTRKYGCYKIVNPTIILRKKLLTNGYIKQYKTVLCECECGKQKYLILDRVLKYTTESCKSCSNSKIKKYKGTGIGEITGTRFHYMEKNAKKSKIEYNISREYLWNLYLQQNRKCALSGLPIKFAPNKQKMPDWENITASLDRINSKIGYIEGNVQWVHKIINIMKNTLSNNEFIYFCNQVTYNNENFEPSVTIEDTKSIKVMKVQRLTDETSSVNNSDTSAQHPKQQDDDIV